MTGKRVVLSARARRDLREATGWYRQEGGGPLALRWVAAVKQALGHIGVHPNAGSPRYAIELQIEGMRCWPVKGFPYLIFYLEREHQIDVGRVLHGLRDVPTRIGETR